MTNCCGAVCTQRVDRDSMPSASEMLAGKIAEFRARICLSSRNYGNEQGSSQPLIVARSTRFLRLFTFQARSSPSSLVARFGFQALYLQGYPEDNRHARRLHCARRLCEGHFGKGYSTVLSETMRQTSRNVHTPTRLTTTYTHTNDCHMYNVSHEVQKPLAYLTPILSYSHASILSSPYLTPSSNMSSGEWR
jgi:hypothetical protein